MILDSATNSGKIALGASPNSDVTGTNAGIYMDGTGDFLAYGDSDNFIKFNVGGSPVLEIKAEDIDLQGSNFKLEADGSSGTFYLGSITSDSDTSGAGVFMDSGGHFRVIGNATNQLIVDGGSMTLKSDTFNLETSDADLVIDSPNKLISLASGNITLDGDSNSSAGHIEAGGLSSTATNQTAAGVYIKGDGEFLAKATTVASEDYIKFSSSGLELKTAALTFETNGDITSDDFLIERTRLFGFGSDGNVVLQSDDCTFSGGSGSAARTNSSTIKDARNTTICTRSGDEWTLQGDWYPNNLTLDDSAGDVSLLTNGYRLFVRKTLTVDGNGTIQNNGSAGQAGTQADNDSGGMGGAGGVGGSLGAGTKGTMGGKGGTVTFSTPTSTTANGVKGGGGGGSGGIVFISARTIVNNGGIESRGGAGGNGAQAGVSA